jgi:hypothetical protein
MKRPNPLPPDKMTAAERHAELCRLLALGIVRLQLRDRGELTEEKGEIRLHSPADQCRHATPTRRRKT